MTKADWHTQQKKSDLRIAARLATIREKIKLLINNENPEIMDMQELCTMQTRIEDMIKRYSNRRGTRYEP